MANDWKNVQYKDGKFKTGTGGGGGSSTFADLDDVSFSNLQNGQVPKYNSTTQKWENANESGGGHTYSTTEQVAGTWIDGKPIYELTLDSSFSNSSSSRKWITLISSADMTAIGIDTFISANGSIIDTYGDKYAIPNSLGTSAMYLGLGLISQGFCMLIENGGNGTIYYKITLRYTKTTDV